MMRKSRFVAPIIALSLVLSASSIGYAQQPLIQITSAANNSTATEGTTITIIVSADSSLQNMLE